MANLAGAGSRLQRPRGAPEEIASKADLDKVEAAVEVEVAQAVEFAETSPDPAPEALFENVYVEEA